MATSVLRIVNLPWNQWSISHGSQPLQNFIFKAIRWHLSYYLPTQIIPESHYQPIRSPANATGSLQLLVRIVRGFYPQIVSCKIPKRFGEWEDLGTPQTPPGRLRPLDPQALLPLLLRIVRAFYPQIVSCKIPKRFGQWEDLRTPQTPPGRLRPMDPQALHPLLFLP